MSPDEVEYEACWITKAGRTAVVLKGGVLNHRCGYVLIENGQPYYGELEDIDVHGGLTYSGELWGINPKYWWVGFDAAHYNDTYEGGRPLAYMKDECEKLAEQLVKRGY